MAGKTMRRTAVNQGDISSTAILAFFKELEMEKLMTQVKQFVQDEEGASAVEYGVLVALIIVVCIATIKAIGGNLNNAFEKVNNAIK